MKNRLSKSKKNIYIFIDTKLNKNDAIWENLLFDAIR